MLIPSTYWERDRKQIFQKSHGPFQQAVDKGVNKGYDFDDFSQDLYSSLYQINPKFPELATPGTSWAKKALDELRSLPEFKQARESGTKCNSFQSGLGASILTRHFAESLPYAPKEDNPDDAQRQIENLESLLEEFTDEQIEANNKLSNLQGDMHSMQSNQQGNIDAWEQATNNLDSGQIRQAFRKGLREAQQEAQKIEDACNAYGYGTEPGNDGYTDAAQKLAIARKIQNSPKLKEIAELAGRFRVEARKEQANKKRPGPDELVDIETGNDLGKIIPTELMKLNNPETEALFFKGFLERSLLQYKTEVVEKESKGPIIFCIDNSGSMTGSPEILSKSLALAMCQIAVDQKRSFAIMHFNTKVARIDKFPRTKVDPKKLIESCAYFSSGGTSFEPPLLEALDFIDKEEIEGFKKADVIFMTDGEASLSTAVMKRVNQYRKNHGVRIFSIIIGGYNTDELRPISDEWITIKNLLGTGSDEETKKTLFSI